MKRKLSFAELLGEQLRPLSFGFQVHPSWPEWPHVMRLVASCISPLSIYASDNAKRDGFAQLSPR